MCYARSIELANEVAKQETIGDEGVTIAFPSISCGVCECTPSHLFCPSEIHFIDAEQERTIVTFTRWLSVRGRSGYRSSDR